MREKKKKKVRERSKMCQDTVPGQPAIICATVLYQRCSHSALIMSECAFYI